MKKLTTLFLVAVLGPSLVLAWLATRSLKDQEMVMRDQIERRAEDMTATVAQDVNLFMDDVRLFYRQQVDDLVKENRKSPDTTWLKNFDQSIRSRWGQVKVGTVIGGDGLAYFPSSKTQDQRVQDFLDDNNSFFANKAVWEVYRAPARQTNDVLAVTADEPEARDVMAVSGEISLDDEAVAMTRSQKRLTTSDGFVAKGVKKAEPRPTAEIELEKKNGPSRKRALAPKAISPSNAKSVSQSKALQPSWFKSDEKVALKSIAVKGEENEPSMKSARLSSSGVMAERNLSEEARKASSPVKVNVAPQYSKLRSQTKGQMASENIQAGNLSFENRSKNIKQSAGEKAVPAAQALGGQSAPLIESKEDLQEKREMVLAKQGQVQTLDLADLEIDALKQSTKDTQQMAVSQTEGSGGFASLSINSGVMEEVIGEEREGALGRFLEDGLHLYLWYRPQELNSKIFWVELELNELRKGLQGIISGATFPDGDGFCLGLLDEDGQLVGKNQADYSGNWSEWLVKSEIGSILPRWMVTAYLVNPKELAQSARSLRMTILLLVIFLIVAIGIGGWLIIKETGREMYLARQKTDFVSNVSHELKTPLTSIRMFSELLRNVEKVDDKKRVEYASIIDNETGRLTRLINQLLDFSRLERGGKRYDFEELDVAILVEKTVENYRHQLESDGANLKFFNLMENNERLVKGDGDALSQIVLNLLSNAEKYGGSSPEIEVEVRLNKEERLIEIRVKDRGKGISRRESAKIFEKFYRVDDSLASGIEGSGLGLSLARQLARAHGGDLVYQNRKKGGSCFVLSLPISQEGKL